MENHEHQDYEFRGIIVCAAVQEKNVCKYIQNMSRGREKSAINRGYFIKSNLTPYFTVKNDTLYLQNGMRFIREEVRRTPLNIFHLRDILRMCLGPLLVFPPLSHDFIRRFMTSPYQMTNGFNLRNLGPLLSQFLKLVQTFKVTFNQNRTVVVIYYLLLIEDFAFLHSTIYNLVCDWSQKKQQAETCFFDRSQT